MIDYNPIIKMISKRDAQRPRAEQLRRIDGSAEFARLTRDNIALPSAFVVADNERVTQSGGDSVLVNCEFSVIIGCTNASTRHGFGAEAILRTHRTLVFAALYGHSITLAAGDSTPEPALSRDINWQGGERIEFDQHNLWWRDRYQVEICVEREYLNNSQLPAFAAINHKPALTAT